ncbi:unnamed protein product [Rhizophagus irregularis]|nr:unnamed protein product [Rhizophagus irregularis]
MSSKTLQSIEESELPPDLKEILPCDYKYQLEKIDILPSLFTEEDIELKQFIFDLLINIQTKDDALIWFEKFQEKSKTTMRITRGQTITGKKIVFKEERHCIHSKTVKTKQGSRTSKQENSLRTRNINCQSKMLMRIEKRKLIMHVHIEYIHNHIPYSAESLSFRPVSKITRNKYIELFKNGYSPATAIYTYEDSLHLAAANEKELITLLADRATNPDYNFVYNLFKKYREINLGASNGSRMFEKLKEVKSYNNSGLGSAILCEYNKELGQPFVLAIVTNLMKRVHEKIRQAGEICYFDASSSFDPLNTSITLLYTSCAAGALPLGLFLTSDESEVTIEFAINKLKSILPSNAFFGRGVDLGPSMFMTDDSAAERNAIELCWPNSKRFLCIFHVLQALWRWLWNANNQIKKDDRSTVISDFKRILYANSENIMNVEYQKFQLQWYNKYSKLARHCSLLWERREFWAVSFRDGALTRGNHTNNYVERSFGIIKDIIFSRVKAYNPVQVYFFIIGNMERFYERKLLAIANKQLNSISKRFFCPGWESVDQNKIVSANIEHMYYVQSTSKSDTFYIVDSNIGICTCPKGNAGGPCKHQAAVAVKFHQSSINYIPSLSLDDRMCYTYIAQGICVMDKSFYVKFHAEIKTKDFLENNATNVLGNDSNINNIWENNNTNSSESPKSPLENNNAGPSENNHANLLENNALRLLDTNSSEIFARSSELELNHQNREYRVKHGKFSKGV